MKPVTPSECADLNTDSCGMPAPNANCSNTYGGFRADCNSAPDYEIEYFTGMIAQLNASHGLQLALRGTRTFPSGVFAPVKDILVALIIYDFPAIKLSSFRSAEGNFPVMRSLELKQCSDIEIHRTDLLIFPALRAFHLWYGSTVAINWTGCLWRVALSAAHYIWRGFRYQQATSADCPESSPSSSLRSAVQVASRFFTRTTLLDSSKSRRWNIWCWWNRQFSMSQKGYLHSGQLFVRKPCWGRRVQQLFIPGWTVYR